MNITQNRKYHTNRVKNKSNRNKQNKTYRKNKSSKKLRKTLKTHKGGNTPYNPDIQRTKTKTADANRQILIDAKKAVLSITKERTEAELVESKWQEEPPMIADNNILPLSMNISDKLTEYQPFPFWDKLFTSEELKQIVDMLKSEVCSEVKEIIPAFEIKALVKFPEPVEEMSDGVNVYNIDNIIHYTRNQEEVDRLKASYDVDLPAKSKIMCATLMILGIISSKMQTTNQEYTLVAKGGVAVSFALSNLTSGDIRVPINDLDFKIISTSVKQPDEQPNPAFVLAKHIGGLVAWLLKEVIRDGYSISTLVPSEKSQQTGYKDIVKLSVKRPDGKYIPILDLDFGNNVYEVNYFKSTFRIQDKIPKESGVQVSYIYQSDRQMLGEKIYYYTKYFILRTRLVDNDIVRRLRLNPTSLIRTPDLTTLTYERSTDRVMIEYKGEIIDVAMCDRFLEKFKRSILLLVTAITQTNKTTIDLEHAYVDSESNTTIFKNTLERLLVIQYMRDLVEQNLDLKISHNIITEVVDSIYSRMPGTIV